MPSWRRGPVRAFVRAFVKGKHGVIMRGRPGTGRAPAGDFGGLGIRAFVAKLVVEVGGEHQRADSRDSCVVPCAPTRSAAVWVTGSFFPPRGEAVVRAFADLSQLMADRATSRPSRIRWMNLGLGPERVEGGDAAHVSGGFVADEGFVLRLFHRGRRRRSRRWRRRRDRPDGIRFFQIFPPNPRPGEPRTFEQAWTRAPG